MDGFSASWLLCLHFVHNSVDVNGNAFCVFRVLMDIIWVLWNECMITYNVSFDRKSYKYCSAFFCCRSCCRWSFKKFQKAFLRFFISICLILFIVNVLMDSFYVQKYKNAANVYFEFPSKYAENLINNWLSIQDKFIHLWMVFMSFT